MSKVIYFTPVCEWNDYVGFNGFLFDLKQKYSFKEIVVVVPNKALSIITEADKFITISDDSIEEYNNYPNVLEELDTKLIKLGNDSFITHGRNKSNLFELCYDYIKKSPDFTNHKLRFYEKEVNYYQMNCVESYKNTFGNLQKLIHNSRLIKPRKEIYSKINKKYKNLFNKNNKTYMIITRNFTNKAPAENTINLLPNLEQIIDYLTKNNIKIINVGFPAQHYNINNKNYLELSNENLTQEELIALMYNCDGVLMSGRSGGFAAHVQSNVDIFMIYPEWSVENKDINIEVFETRKNNNLSVASVDISELVSKNDYSGILNILLNHKKSDIISFSKRKKIIYCDKLVK